ncbi:MAG: DUF305 domain-containing protein [Gemmatimonadaceae bacterium]|nr:DUF305 domain-containing protein [Gemmatimonadaceae bacterium]
MSRRLHALALTTLALLLTACGGARAATSTAPVAAVGPLATKKSELGAEGAKARARADSIRMPYTQADIDFMSGMIHHHAQAILISKWAPTRGASDELLRLTGRIINAQTDEIALMSGWLIDRNQTPPAIDSLGNVAMDHNAMGGHGGHGSQGASMPGMLSQPQLDSLDAARGKDFDILFLRYMIQHHRGAITMVETLLASHGAAQNQLVFKFAADVAVDQNTEVRRMMTMLIARGVMPDGD